MKVGVDGRSLVGGGGRGVAHYTSALLGALVETFPEDEWRVLLPRGPVHGLARGVTVVRSQWPGRLLWGAAAALGRPRLDALLGGGLDVVWAPAPAPLAVGRGVPLVLTVHDRSWEQRPGDFTAYERLWHAAARPRALAREAARVLCDAEAVRADLVTAWGLDPARVRAVPLAPAIDAGRGQTPRFSSDSKGSDPYFLFVGALEPRKAPEVLLAAHAEARRAGLAAELWFAGEGRVAVGGEGVRRLGRAGDAELPALYAGALALVLPSRLEGFGLPPVEALAHGTPAIVSDLPVFRETLGPEGALYVPPGDTRALAAALLRLERERGLRDRLVAAGRAATAGLSWAATARATRAVLAEAAG
ncbi:MAG TPA: glycosyltransferase family 1 protein [Solirubrobacteraceae bacterium]